MESSGIWSHMVAAVVSIAVTLVGVWVRRYMKETKQKRFHDRLKTDPTLTRFRTEPLLDSDAEKGFVEERRKAVKERVAAISNDVFGQDVPEDLHPPLEGVEYPEIPCKWCYENVRPESGAHGRCSRCYLPLCYWIASAITPEPSGNELE